MTLETYCPECKQNVPHEEGQSCPNCSYEFESRDSFDLEMAQAELAAIDANRMYTRGYVQIPRAELEELISGLETFRHHVRNLGDLDEGERRASDIADSLREKYLGGAS